MTALLTACSATVAMPTEQPTHSPMPSPSPALNRSVTTISPALAVSPTPLEDPVQDSAQNPAVISTRAVLAKKLGVEPDAVKLISVEEVQWPDGCLGVKRPGVMCTQEIVDGFRIVLEASGTRYDYHTDAMGRQTVLASPK